LESVRTSICSRPAITPDASVPAAVIDVTGVRADLLALANAERAHLASNGTYAPLAGLLAAGVTDITRDRRPNYVDAVETSATEFRLIASCSGLDLTSPQRLSIDESMVVRADE
jgi:hypothetical protein